MHAQCRAGARPGRALGGSVVAGAARALPPTRPAGLAHRGRPLVTPPPQRQPHSSLARRRPQPQQPQQPVPLATPERQQQHPRTGQQPAAEEVPPTQHPWWSDEYKEEYRKRVRVVFDFERWRRHRSSGRYLRHMLSLARSNTMQGLAQPLAVVMLVSLGVGAYHAAAAAGVLPLWPAIKMVANVPFGYTSFALSLLLVFRTNSSYSRWDEARKLWGMVVNRSRDLVRQALGYIPPHQADLQSTLCRWTIAYSRSLMCHLREDEDLAAELKDVLLPEELDELLAADHRPNFCCQVLTEVIREAQLHSAVTNNRDALGCVPAGAAYRMDENLTMLADVTGGCERLLKTPIPLAYTRHTSRFLVAWLTLLPWVLWETCGWAMLPVIAVVSFILLGIEEIGVSIEEPFSILPLENICARIEDSVREMVSVHCARLARRAQRGAPLPTPAELLKRHSGAGSSAPAPQKHSQQVAAQAQAHTHSQRGDAALSAEQLMQLAPQATASG